MTFSAFAGVAVVIIMALSMSELRYVTTDIPFNEINDTISRLETVRSKFMSRIQNIMD